jgi:hypothetical protein
MKVQSLGPIHNLPKKMRKNLSNSRCKVVKVKVVSKEVGVGKNGARTHVVRKYFHAHPRTNL